MKDTVIQRKRQVVALVASLPEATITPGGEGHLSFAVRGKRFGYLLSNHHGDGRIALNCKTASGVNQRLVDAAPERFHLPKYLARQGWLGLWIDLPQIDWVEIEDVLTEGFRIVAPRSLVAKLPSPRSDA